MRRVISSSFAAYLLFDFVALQNEAAQHSRTPGSLSPRDRSATCADRQSGFEDGAP
jgi:hypothetical protein